MSCMALLPLATFPLCFSHRHPHPNLWTSNAISPVAAPSEGVRELGTHAVHQSLSSLTAFIASLSQEFGVVFGTVEASSQHRGQCQYTVEWPHLRRVFYLFKWSSSWFGATGRSFSSVKYYISLSETSCRRFWCFLLPVFYGVIKISSSSETHWHVLLRWLSSLIIYDLLIRFLTEN